LGGKENLKINAQVPAVLQALEQNNQKKYQYGTCVEKIYSFFCSEHRANKPCANNFLVMASFSKLRKG